MKHLQSTLSRILVMLCLSYFVHLGCSSTDNPAAPDNKPAENVKVQTASKTGVDIYQNVASFEQITSLIVDSNQITKLDIPQFETPGAALAYSRTVKNKALVALRKRPDALNRLQSATSDSVIFDVTERDTVAGVTYRVSLIYNAESGTARFFVVGFDYRETHPLEYDSTEVKADLNGTLLNESDDVLLSLMNLKRYKPGQLIREEMGRFVPDEHAPGTEPDGGVLTSDITYSSSSFISSTSARFEYHADSGGSFSKTSVFSDNTTHSESVTFNLDGTGTFEESRRDGTQISGTFDSAEEDGEGGYTLTITFPEGHDPASISESGQFVLNQADGTLSGSFEREVTPLEGDVQRESVEVSQTREGDILITTLNVENSDGSHGFITITETPEVDQIGGEWTNADETFVVFTAQGYPDDSAHLEFQVYASEVAFENGDDPIITAVFDFYPDGSGQGVVTEGEDVYDVVIHPDGSVTVTKRS
ncbi:MAG: hypothetical protein ACE5IY_13760 [bacterium]